jgi:hypothetical protein
MFWLLRQGGHGRAGPLVNALFSYSGAPVKIKIGTKENKIGFG